MRVAIIVHFGDFAPVSIGDIPSKGIVPLIYSL
jgi:hypothetical protein